MTQNITDATLGRRFWAVNDFSKLAAPNAANAPNVPAAEAEENNKLSPNILSFINAGGDTMAQSAINKAQLFAATHTLTNEEVDRETAKSEANLLELVGNNDAVTQVVNAVKEVFIQRNAGVTQEAAERFCRTALNKLMATDEFDARAHVPVQQGAPENARRLGVKGLNSLKNAMLGLAGMLKDGTIREDAVLILANEKYYDAANRTDLLRLATDSAKKVKELFIGKDRYEALIQQCEDRLGALGNNISENQRTLINGQISALKTLKNEAINLRTEATVCIKTDYQIQDPSGKITNERKFQWKQLKKICDSLRAFRYDLDNLNGKKMGPGEWIRRKFDDIRSSLTQNRITADQYNTILQNDNTFNECLRTIRNTLSAAEQAANLPFNPAAPEPQANMDDFEKVSDNVSLNDTIISNDFAKAATTLSHLTNNRLRYHFSGVEKNEAENYKAISDELGSIAKNGGERTVALKMGVKAMLDLNLIAADFKTKAGFTGDVTAKIKVDNADGTVNVTYSIGGKGEFSAGTYLGANPKMAGSQDGYGGMVEGKVSAGATRSVTKTYANLKEFAKTASRLNILMTPRPREIFYAWGKAVLKVLKKGFLLGTALVGLRKRHSLMDMHKYNAVLRNRNIFGNMGGIFLKKRNLEIIGERKTVSFTGALQGNIKGGYYFKNGESLASNIEVNISGGIDYSRELSVNGKFYKSFANSLSGCSEVFLRNKFTADAANMADNWKDPLITLVNNTDGGNVQEITRASSALVEILTQLEDSVIDVPKKNAAFWHNFAQKAKLLAVATALLTKRAAALDDGANGAANAKTAAKAAGGYIIPRLANPVIKIPSNVFHKEFFDVFEMTAPRTTRTVINVKASYDALGNLVDEKMNDYGIGKEAKKTVQGNLLNTSVETGVSFTKGTLGLSGNVEGRITIENVVSKHQDARPWLRKGKRTIDVRLPTNLPLRFIVDTATRHYIKSRGGLSELDKSQWQQEFKSALIDSLKNNVEDLAIENIPNLLDYSLKDLAEQYPAIGKFVGGISFLKNKRKDDYQFTDASYKTLSFELDNNWRFTSFKLSNDYDTDAKLEITPTSFIAIELSLSSKTSVNNWIVYPKPKPNTLLKLASDYIAAGNPKGFVNLLARNKKGVLRLMDAVKHNAPDRPNDKYWQADKEAMNNLLAECINHLNTFANENTLLAEQAKVVRQTFMNFINNVVNPPENLNDGGKLELAAQFFTTIAQIYTLKEMSNHQPEQILQQPQQVQLENQNHPGQIQQQPQNPHPHQLEDQNQPEQNLQQPQLPHQLEGQNQPEQNLQQPQLPHEENPLGQNQQPQQNQPGQNLQPPQGQLEPLPEPQVEPLPNSWSNAQPVRNLLQQDPE